MNATFSPFANFSSYVQGFLHSYLLLIAIGVPLVILFIMVMGRKSVEGQRAEEAAPALPPADTRTPILIVDDSAVARAKLGKLFEGAGYKVALAKDGVEAMELMAASYFAVLVTDLEMPNMSGIELIAAVQGSIETEDMPVIAITGHDELHAHVHAYQGLYGIFKKPWNDRELLKRVEALSHLRKQPVQSRRASDRQAVRQAAS
jgi:DNA-binding NtrC family response regulator